MTTLTRDQPRRPSAPCCQAIPNERTSKEPVTEWAVLGQTKSHSDLVWSGENPASPHVVAAGLHSLGFGLTRSFLFTHDSR